MTAGDYFEIEKYVPRQTDAELHEYYRARFDEQAKEYFEFLNSQSPKGNIDSVIEGAATAQWDASNKLAETVPATMAGVLALLLYIDEFPDADSSLRDEQGMPVLLSSPAKAAKALLPQGLT